MSRLIHTGATAAVITTDEAKAYARVDYADEDTLFDSLIVAATERAELFLGRSLINSVWKFYLAEFLDEIVIPMPWSSVDQIDYLDTDGAGQTLSTSIYQVNLLGLDCRITTKPNQSWPSIQEGVYNPITITGKSGFGDDSDSVPDSIKTAVKIMVNTAFNQRESISIGVNANSLPMPATVEAMLNPFKVVKP